MEYKITSAEIREIKNLLDQRQTLKAKMILDNLEEIKNWN